MESVISNILQNIHIGKNYFVGIDGGTGSGKTTIAEELKKSLQAFGSKVVVLHIDDFIHKRDIRYDVSQDEWYCYYYSQWRYDYLIKEILQPAKKSEKIDKVIELYEKETDNYILKQLCITPGSIILLEGVFLQREELKGLLDFIVYIDVERSERLNRVIIRDTYIGDDCEIKNKYKKRYFVAEDYYVNEYKPIDNADVVYRN